MYLASDMRNWELEEDIADVIGWHELCDSIMMWMSADDANECLDALARDYEIYGSEDER